MINGSCLCRQVMFSINGPVIDMGNCHCTECRKAYGSAFGTIAVCRREQFKYIKGQDLISFYQQTERVTRYFCKSCGSPLPMVEDWDPLVGIPAGLLDDDPGQTPSQHIFVAHKAPWWDITDDIPQYQEWSPESDPSKRDNITPPGVKNP
jgi:hypothetical protein